MDPRTEWFPRAFNWETDCIPLLSLSFERFCRTSVFPGACPRIRRGRAHGACAASARRKEEAMSVHIVEDEQRSDRRAIPMRSSDSGRRRGIRFVGAPRRCAPTSPASRRLASATAGDRLQRQVPAWDCRHFLFAGAHRKRNGPGACRRCDFCLMRLW